MKKMKIKSYKREKVNTILENIGMGLIITSWVVAPIFGLMMGNIVGWSGILIAGIGIFRSF